MMMIVADRADVESEHWHRRGTNGGPQRPMKGGSVGAYYQPPTFSEYITRQMRGVQRRENGRSPLPLRS